METHTAAIERPESTLVVSTSRFGTVEQVAVRPAALYTFPEALPGLPDSHRYALIVDDAYAPLRWLQSLDEEAVCLPVLAPAAIGLTGYDTHVAEAAGEPADPEFGCRVLLITRYDGANEVFLTNLLAPILLDQRTGTARQLILEEQSYPLRQRLDWDAATRTFSLPC